MAERQRPRRRGRPQQPNEPIDPELARRRQERVARQRAMHEQARQGGPPPARREQARYQAQVLETSLRVGISHRLNLVLIALAMAVTLPGLYLRLIVGHSPLEAPVNALIFGAAIVGSAFILAWAAEAAEMDISQGLAIAFLALVAVLPEYAVDLYLAWQAGLQAANPVAVAGEADYASLALANMTGANRLLMGFAWPMVVFLYWFRTRRRSVDLHHALSVEIVVLALATIYAFTVPWKGSLSLFDTLVYVSLFAAYITIVARAGVGEPELVGPALTLGVLPVMQRRLAVTLLFVFSGAVIFSSAEPFAENLIGTGRQFGIDEFLLVQWLAPLASEAPEVIIAFLFVWRGHAVKGLTAVVSAQVNQWTLLVGTLPVVFSVALGSPGALPLDSRQLQELILTAAQSALGIAILAKLRFILREATILFVLFGTHLVFSDPLVRWGYVGVFLALAAGLLLVDRQRMGNLGKLFVETIKGTR